jgi:hypothetical protein
VLDEAIVYGLLRLSVATLDAGGGNGGFDRVVGMMNSFLEIRLSNISVIHSASSGAAVPSSDGVSKTSKLVFTYMSWQQRNKQVPMTRQI